MFSPVDGGVDINVSKRIVIRAIQADSLPIFSEGEVFHNLRISAGVVLKFQSRGCYYSCVAQNPRL